jgi:hypothetical protein
MSEKTKVSRKQILPYLEVINPMILNLRAEVEKMPYCTKKTSLLLTMEALQKKATVEVKEVSESAVMDYVNKHPEVLQRLAHFAASDKGAVEVANEVLTESEKTEARKPKDKKKR